jgi:site-specific recombinase XerD
MRHTFGCRWLERGGSLAALQAILGHSTIVTTQRYARLSDDHVRAEVERIGGDSVATSVAS